MRVAARRNWPGILSIVLAAASVAMYWAGSITGSNPDYVGGFTNFALSAFQLGSATSALVGFLALLRARRGAGGMVTAIIGLVIGGTLLVLWVAWIGMLIFLNPPGLGE